MKRSHVMIMTASFGNGHQSVSKALMSALEEDYQVTIVDILDWLIGPLKVPLIKGYGVLTKDFKNLYNWFYQYKKEAPNNHLDGLMYQMFKRRFRDKMILLAPDFVISTFPMSSAFVSRYKAETGSHLPLITVLTDVVDSWEWLHEETDLYFVPTGTVKLKLIAKGVKEEKIRITGIPVDKAFKQAGHEVFYESKAKSVLLMASAISSTPIDSSLLKAFATMKEVDFTIVTGKDAQLYTQLRGLLEPIKAPNIHVKAYVKDMAQLMQKMDLICTKAGGVTLFEVIHMNLPLLVQASYFGQEEANVRFVEEEAIGRVVHNSQEMFYQMKELLGKDNQRRQMKDNMLALRNEMQSDYVEALQ